MFLRDQSWDLSFSIFMYRIYKGRFSAVVTNMQTTPHSFNIPNHRNLTSVESLNEYSTNSNLALNSTKTKWTMLSTRQMSTVHSLEEHSANIICREEPLERLSSTRLLGVQVGSKFIMAGTHNESSILMLCDLVCAEKAKKFCAVSYSYAAS